MKILAFDTSTTACTVALQNNEEIRYLHENAPMQHTKLILPMISELLAEFSMDIAELDAIAYGTGPGSFTGIRIAVSVAQGLAFAAQKPVISVSSLAVLAATAFQQYQCKNMLIAVDARMDEIYWANYQIHEQGLVKLNGQEALLKPADVGLPDESDYCGVGDGWNRYAHELRTRGLKPEALFPSVLPSAEAMLPLARIKFEQKQWLTAAEAAPVYLR